MLATLRRFYRRCDAIFAPSEFMAQLLREQRMNYDVGIWTRGIDREIFDPGRRDLAWRRSLGIADDDAGGRLRRPAGHGERASTSSPTRSTGWRGAACRHKVLIVGKGPAREWFEKRLPDAVFAGFQCGEDLGRAVASMDMLFNPSITETFGNVTLEAMAAGLPVVAAIATEREPGHRGRDRAADPARRDRAILRRARLLLHRRRRPPRGRRSRYRACQRYGWDEINHELAEAYMRVIRQHNEGGRQQPSPVP